MGRIVCNMQFALIRGAGWTTRRKVAVISCHSSKNRPRQPPPKRRSDLTMKSPTIIADSDIRKLLGRYLPRSESVVMDENLYRTAMLHRSCGRDRIVNASSTSQTMSVQAELPAELVGKSYERLEFLGDAVLGLVTASYLFERYPNEAEGFLTQMRMKLVNGKMLAQLCSNHTPLMSFVVGRQSTLGADIAEDVFEAFVGALFIDRGYDVAHRWLVAFFEDNVDFANLVSNQASIRSELNRRCFKHHGYLPETRVVSSDATRVCVQVTSPSGIVLATGSGANRKDAEDQALRIALGNTVAV